MAFPFLDNLKKLKESGAWVCVLSRLPFRLMTLVPRPWSLPIRRSLMAAFRCKSVARLPFVIVIPLKPRQSFAQGQSDMSTVAS